MGISISNPSYDKVYTAYAWRYNSIFLNMTQGEGIEDTGVVWNDDGTIDQQATSQLSVTADHVKVPRFQLRDDRGIIDLTDCQVVLAVKRPKGAEDLLACYTVGDASDGTIACPITRSVTAIEGRGLGEIRVLSQNAVIKFYGIHFNIYKGVSDLAAEQSTQFAALVSALQKVALVDPDGSNTVDMDTEVAENGTNPVASGVIYDFVNSALNDGSKVSYETVTSPDNATDNGTVYYVNTGTNMYLVIPASAAAWQTQLRIDVGGNLYIRNRRSRESDWSAWKNISKDVDPDVVRSIIDDYISDHGITSGKSAYEIAVDNGYVGTEEQWLDSLKGAKGDSGLRGTSISRVRIDRGYLYVETSTPQEDGTIVVADGKIGYVAGESGRNGRNGRSVQSLSINNDGELIATIRVYDDYNNYTDMVGSLGRVVGADGAPGAKGDPGDDYVLTAADKNDIADLAAGLINKQVSHINDAIDPTYLYLVEGVQSLNVIGTGPYRVFVVRTGNETSGTITQYILAKQGSDSKGHVYIRNGTISNGTITFAEGAEEVAKKADIPTQISELTNNRGYQTASEVAQKVSEGIKPFLCNDDYVVYADGTISPMAHHSSSNNALVNELYCSPIGQLDVTGWNQYTNLTTAYINAKESEIVVTGTIPQGVTCYYREGTNSEYFLTENTVIKALGALLNAKESTANKVTAVGSSATDTQYPSARAVYQIISTVANSSEVKSNKVTAISSNSTDTQYPSAKAVFTAVNMPPQYVIDEAESVLAKAFAHKGLGRTIRFIAVSDSHNDATEASYAYTRVSNQHCGQAVKYIADRIPLDFVAFLGDMTWAGVAHTTAQYQTDWLKEDIQEMNLFLKDGFSGVPNIRVVGNHDQCATTDSGGTVSRLQNSGAYQYFGRYNAGVSDGLSNYGYYDLNNVKVRIIYLNTSDAVNVSSQGTYLGITAAQKNWLCETLIDLNTKTDAASWKILLMSHAPLDMISGLAADILIPYTNGGTYGNYTFTNHSAKIIGNCHGHTHCYNVGYISDTIRRFTIPNSNFYDNNHYKNNANYAAWTEETTYPKTQNSRTDTSFSLVTIDLDNLTCYVDNYGAGYDRNFSVDYKKPVSSISNLSYTGTTTVGQNINTSAISYTVNYSDGSASSRAGNVTVSPVTIQQVGNNAVTVSYTENGTTVTGTLTIVGTEPPVVRLLDLDRTEATATVDSLIPFDTTKCYTNISYSTVKGYNAYCTVYSKSSDSISLKESGVGGVAVGYPVELPDTSSSYTFTCDFNGTGKVRIYYRLFDSSGTQKTSTSPAISTDASATGSVTATIAAPGGDYKWLIIMISSNTASEKEYTNVSLTKDS